MYVTNFTRTDGFGAQYQTIIYSAIYSEIIKKQFAYTPFSHMEHNYTNDLNFLNKKEQFINVINNFPNALQLKNVVSLTPNIYSVIESNVELNFKRPIFLKIKNIFHENKVNRFDYNYQNIAIHIRRLNCNDNNSYNSYHLDNSYYIKAINFFRKTPIKKMFHIYSQGKDENFKDFIANDIKLHLNEPIENTFYDLTVADILVTSKSSFSYVAGLLSKGAVYYAPFWHPKLPGWKLL